VMADPNFHSVFTLDAETGRLFWHSPPKNHAEKKGAEAGAVTPATGRNKPYWQVRAFGRTFKRSRVIFHMTHGYWPEPAVDHINGNSLDDRPINLRAASLSQNRANSKARPRSRHALPEGVSLTRQGKFMARLCSKSLGVFSTPADASIAYQKAKTEVYGDFA